MRSCSRVEPKNMLANHQIQAGKQETIHIILGVLDPVQDQASQDGAQAGEQVCGGGLGAKKPAADIGWDDFCNHALPWIGGKSGP